MVQVFIRDRRGLEPVHTKKEGVYTTDVGRYEKTGVIPE
jgi:hypothetical protein